MVQVRGLWLGEVTGILLAVQRLLYQQQQVRLTELILL
jgi:hypothetical protein